MNTVLYIVERGRYGTGDLSGSLITAKGEALYSHISSNSSWLRLDLTENFGRAADLAERFPDGYTVEYVAGTDPLPAVLVPFFETTP